MFSLPSFFSIQFWTWLHSVVCEPRRFSGGTGIMNDLQDARRLAYVWDQHLPQLGIRGLVQRCDQGGVLGMKVTPKDTTIRRQNSESCCDTVSPPIYIYIYTSTTTTYVQDLEDNFNVLQHLVEVFPDSVPSTRTGCLL